MTILLSLLPIIVFAFIAGAIALVVCVAGPARRHAASIQRILADADASRESYDSMRTARTERG